MFVSESDRTRLAARPAASILHADLDAFYASVEQRDDPRLRGVPVIVGGGVVLAASYEAKAFGVRTASGVSVARRLCPDAIVVPPRMRAYTEASRAVFDVFGGTTPIVEALSIDEAFLDVSGLGRIAGTPVEIAAALRRDVYREVGLPITVGVARTKFLAKVASAVGKPDGLLHVPPDRELEFLHPLPVERLWGVGRVTSTKLRGAGIHTVGQLAQESEDRLTHLLGTSYAHHLHALAWARDPRRVDTGRRRKSVGAQCALGSSTRSAEDIAAVLMSLVDRVAGRLRRADRAGRTVVLRLRLGDYTRITRSHTLRMPTAQTDAILAAARSLLDEAMSTITQRGITLVGIAVQNLQPVAPMQLELPFDADTASPLDGARDLVRERFGTSALTRATLLGRSSGIEVPLLPD
ncbi:DNA polymerase IV [Rhodococcus sp. NPDC058521]|uniref:DNA polymerase IV n=1 Tax=Rhodococcus sp. NPDC058521 TaxID=3346536 RepID=UPI003665AAF3